MNETFFNQLAYYKNYNEQINTKINFFTILHEEYLQNFKEKYKLNKKIRQNEFDTVKELLRWSYEIFLYPNYQESTFEHNNSIDIIEYSIKNKLCLNCYYHSQILLDALNAYGFYARKIYCLPIDCSFYGNHVVTEYFSEKYKKWVMLDSTYNYYFEDEKHGLLSLLELRQNIINKEKIVIHNNNRFQNVVTSEKIDYLQMIIPILIVLQYETHDDDMNYRLISELYRVPDRDKKYSELDKIIYTTNWKSFY